MHNSDPSTFSRVKSMFRFHQGRIPFPFSGNKPYMALDPDRMDYIADDVLSDQSDQAILLKTSYIRAPLKTCFAQRGSEFRRKQAKSMACLPAGRRIAGVLQLRFGDGFGEIQSVQEFQYLLIFENSSMGERGF